jgi:hypothetical protein
LAASKPLGFVIVIGVGAIGAVALLIGWLRLRRREHRRS